MPEYDNQTIMRQEIEHSFDNDNIDWLSIPLERQKTYASDTNIFEPTSQSLSSPHLPLENATIKNTYGLHTILTSKGSNLIADDDDKKISVVKQMPEYDNQTIMRQEIEHSFDSDNID